ncbi:GtrA family protein [Salmonella enterica subsp. enterica serovar 4,5,12:b:-]|uniref:GtrA family protein n=1 Tax=Salmonella enterica subsp. enterica serovar Javiana TaxID=363569 RepID=A0A728EIE6_SALET|nr:GtrA family protein [Salmonella enterica subsp. enterica]EAO3449566.1 GtrA family protein [Salmonella enterica]EBH8382029.1 GtrA family protein [Salmonella enterica subsp. enterica serovar 4,5,12:b:-]EBX8207001.1 GtrA family protein [Salmonella enterica subsp. enterica serovar Javiana]ECS8963616.1 GtrA family protein [Salmonella enterica subsp. enterica serovar Java]ECT9494527.1 GtrA family protein [Salmonella enterica subsp. enterica serovar 4,[5],12:b:-]
MLKLFIRYVYVGVLSDAINLVCFCALFILIIFSQEISNVIAFFVAVMFSFCFNAILMFKAKETSGREASLPLNVKKTYTHPAYEHQCQSWLQALK